MNKILRWHFLLFIFFSVVVLFAYLYIDKIAPTLIYNSERFIEYNESEKKEFGPIRESDRKIKKKLSKLEFYILFRDFRKQRRVEKKNLFNKRLYYLNDDFLVDCEYLKSYFKSLLYSYYESKSMQQLPGAMEGEEFLEDSGEVVPTLTIPHYKNRFKILNENFQFYLQNELLNNQDFYQKLKGVLKEFEGIIDKKFEIVKAEEVDWKSQLPKVKIEISSSQTENHATAIMPHGRKNLGSIVFYKSFFKIQDVQLMKGIIRHEIGHILGFSHENKVLFEDKSILECKNAQRSDYGHNLINVCPDTSSFMMTECIVNSKVVIKPKEIYQFSYMDSLIMDSLFNNPRFKTNEINIFKNFSCN